MMTVMPVLQLQAKHHQTNIPWRRHFAGDIRYVPSSVRPPSFSLKMFTCKCIAAAEKSLHLSATSKKFSVPVMVNDCTGNMGRAVAEAALATGLELVPLSFIGPGKEDQRVQIGDVEVNLHNTSEKEAVIDYVLTKYPDVVVVDYTVPSAVNENAEFYCKFGLPFVMGTTGGDREKLISSVRKANNYTVIAPQMGKQVVAFQAAMEIMAEQFPGAFSGYTLKVTESHQSSKVDTSGTAKAIVSSFQKLGVSFSMDEIEMVRNPTEQIEKVGVPKEYLSGHGFHTYRLTSPDHTVSFQFQHNVCGRSIYVQGTIDAVIFLAKKIQSNAEKRLYNMIDVLREGNMN